MACQMTVPDRDGRRTFPTSFLPFLISGFDDAFRALERLSIYVFDIPVNVAVRQFQDMSEAF